jgi:hypothetical protein
MIEELNLLAIMELDLNVFVVVVILGVTFLAVLILVVSFGIMELKKTFCVDVAKLEVNCLLSL